MAPVCPSCGTIGISLGGSLGTIGAYGVNHPSLTQRRLQADLNVCSDYKSQLIGMIESNKEQLSWSVERYAEVPQSPSLEYLEQKHLEWGNGWWATLVLAEIVGVPGLFIPAVSLRFWLRDAGYPMAARAFEQFGDALGCLGCLVFPVAFAIISAVPVFLLWLLSWRISNSSICAENRRRKTTFHIAVQAHETKKNAELGEAKKKKLAQDHRLRNQIRDAEANLQTIQRKIDSIRSLLDA